MYHNNSVFANENLLQTNGTATGAPNSCSYADIAVSSVDDAVFDKMTSTYPEMLYFGRYRDDCLALWHGTEEKLDGFFTFLNTLNTDLKFTMEKGGKKLCFLDLEITLTSENVLTTTVYSKPTDSHLYLHADSCHNKSSIDGISKGVALRLRRICASDEEYKKKSIEYSSYLTTRGHDKNVVKKAFDKVFTINRSDARKKVVKNNDIPRIVFSTAYNPRGPDVKSIIKSNLHLLEDQPNLQELFPKGSIIVANKKESSLKDLLLRADPYSVKDDLCDKREHGYVRCNKGCDSCENFVDETSFVTSFATGRRFRIYRDSTCTTQHVIYVAYCTKCGKQGVGSTTKWKTRLANYKSHIKHKLPTCRIVKHFINDCTYDPPSIRFIIVDVVNNIESLTTAELDTILLKKEKFWIGTLVTQHKGLNGTHDWNRTK